MKKIMELLQNMKAKNEKKDNKGFSLVELIIVIAIMAILVGIVGTQVLPYINKSKLSKDRELVSSYCTAAVSAYSIVAGELTGDPTSFDVYDNHITDANNKKVAEQIEKLTYKTFDEIKPKFTSSEAKNCSDVTITFDVTNHKVTATLKGVTTDGATALKVESSL